MSKAAYKQALCDAMELVARQSNSIFMGQSVAYPGTAMSSTFDKVPRDKLLELPVFENTQLGMATGMALTGMLPVCVYPRWNFLICATDQLVNHLDKLPVYSRGGFKPKVLIRVGVPTIFPFDPGPQHLGDFSDAYFMLLETVKIYRLHSADMVLPAYEAALASDRSSILVEFTGQYA